VNTSVSLLELLRWEALRLRRERAFWYIALLLTLALFHGYGNALRWAQHQVATLSLERSEQQRAEQGWRERAQTLSIPGGAALAHWQDPTDITGFSRYFLRASATRPVNAMAPLAIGDSDLDPYVFRVRLDLKSTFETSYELVNPLQLTLGRLDTAFVLVALLPLGAIGIGYLMFTSERESGALRLVLAQPVPAARLWLARGLVLWGTLTGIASTGLLASTIFLGGIGAPEPARLVAAFAVVAGYLLLWSALIAMLASLPTKAGTGSILAVTVWIALVILIPALASLCARTLAPLPSRVEYVDTLRAISDRVANERRSVLERHFNDHPELAGTAVDGLNFATARLILVREIERALAPLEQREAQARSTQQRIADTLHLMSPASITNRALADLAGNGPTRQAAFISAVDDHHARLRDFFVPKVLREAAHPSPRHCSDCPGRLTFTEYEAIPRFELSDSSSPLLAHSLAASAFLILCACAIGLVTWRRLGPARLHASLTPD
jgi:ABC-2 type transport system permease protein